MEYVLTDKKKKNIVSRNQEDYLFCSKIKCIIYCIIHTVATQVLRV